MAYLVSQYPAVSHTFIFREIAYLRKRGMDIAIASINEPDPIAAQEEPVESQSTFYIKRQGVSGAVSALFNSMRHTPSGVFCGLFFALYCGGVDLRKLLFAIFYFTEALILGSWMRKRKLNHVHVHFGNPASMVAMIASRIYPITYSLTVHGPDVFSDVYGLSLKEKVENAQFVCCISNYTRSQLMRLVGADQWDKLHVVPLGVDTDVYAARPFRSEPAPFELLCVGRLVPAKGQHVLLAALDLLVQDGRDVRLRLVGRGADRTALERDAAARGLEGRVIFEGALTQEQTLKLYRKSDIFVLASFAEGLPVVLMEAMAMEIPCVATRINGIPELIRHQIDGLLVRPADEVELAAALGRLMDDSTLRMTLSKAGRQRVVNKFSIEKNSEQLLNIFQQYRGHR